MSDFLPILSSVMGVFLVMGIGGFCRWRQWLKPDADQSLAAVIAYVLLPCLFVDRILAGSKLDDLSTVWVPPLVGFGITACGFGLGLLAAKLLGNKIGLDTDAKKRAFALCVGICNYGYIPLPLAEKFYPDAVVDLILHNVGVDLALWSVGIAVVIGGAGWRRIAVNPPLFAVLISMTVKHTVGTDAVPDPLLTAAKMLGDCTIPLGLVLSGAIIVDFLRQANWKGSMPLVIASIGMRQAVMPVLMLAVVAKLSLSINMQQVMVLQAAMPSAVFPIVLVRLFNKDTETALRVVLATSAAGIVLIPTWLAVGKWWFGV